MNLLRNLFSSDLATQSEIGPLGLHLYAGFTLDTLLFRLYEQELLIEFPGENYTIAATGKIDLGAGSVIYRYYTSGDEFLQINTTGGIGIDNIEDVKMFIYEDSSGIYDTNAWNTCLSPEEIGRPKYVWLRKEWCRFFNEEEVGDVAPVVMFEQVENHSGAKWTVDNFSMGYQRLVGNDIYEYLLLNGEETQGRNNEPEWIFSRALGVDIPVTALTIIGK
jgi:hypothetical protein